MRQSTKSTKAKKKERFKEHFKTNPYDFSFVETGQDVAEPNIDERMLDVTPNDHGKPNTMLNQLQKRQSSYGFREYAEAATGAASTTLGGETTTDFSKIRSPGVRKYCREQQHTSSSQAI